MAGAPVGFSIRILDIPKNVPYPIKVNLPLASDTEQHINPRSTGPELDMVVPDDDTRHAILGKFIDEWGLLETTIDTLVAGLLNVDYFSARVVTSVLIGRQLSDLLKMLGLHKLSDTDAAVMGKLIERFEAFNTKRNYLVHGDWILEGQVVCKRGQVCLKTRFVRGVSPANWETLSRN